MNLKSNPYSGLFIALGGIDGSGKSTLASEWLTPYFRDQGLETLLTYEPWFGGKLSSRDMLLKRVIEGALANGLRPDAETLQEWFIENRRRHYAERIGPFLSGSPHRVVVSDRSYDGTLVYGKATVGSEAQKRLLFKHTHLSDFFLPDLLVILDIPVKLALQRIGQDVKRGGVKHIFEKAQTLATVREAYAEFPSFLKAEGVEQETLTVDAQGSLEEIFEHILPSLNALIERKFSFRLEWK